MYRLHRWIPQVATCAALITATTGRAIRGPTESGVSLKMRMTWPMRWTTATSATILSALVSTLNVASAVGHFFEMQFLTDNRRSQHIRCAFRILIPGRIQRENAAPFLFCALIVLINPIQPSLGKCSLRWDGGRLYRAVHVLPKPEH